MNCTLGPGDFLVPMLLAAGPLFPPIELMEIQATNNMGITRVFCPWVWSRISMINDLMPLCFSIVYAYLFPCLSFPLYFADSFFLMTHLLFQFVTNHSHTL